MVEGSPVGPPVAEAKDRPDAGLRSHDHYRHKLPPWRHSLREALIPLIRRETPWLAWCQSTVRSPALDTYFAVTANLGTHTFFMIILPVLFWCGYTTLGRGMVHVLASGVFLSGYLKDLLCLPRPLSPPLKRITMSGTAALEYGFPSTHSTNAVSVAVYALYTIRSEDSTLDPKLSLFLEGLAYCYATSIIMGRIYCGMHGFLDVIAGSLLGAGLSVLQCSYGPRLDEYLYSSGSALGAILFVSSLCVLIRIHPEPADDCPCFDDSLAFAGVMMGCEIGNWHYAVSGWAWDDPVAATVPFDLASMGYLKVLLRIACGVLTIFMWREIMKPAMLRSLPPMFRIIERLGLSLPRRYFVQASEYEDIPARLKVDNVFPSMSDLPSLVDSVRHPRKRAVSIGPQSAADAYEALAYRDRRRRDSNTENGFTSSNEKNGRAFVVDANCIGENDAGRPSVPRAPPPELPYAPPSVNGTLSSPRRGLDEKKNDEREEREMFSQLQRPRVRYDVEVVTKLIVYAGIALLAVEGNPILFELIGLGMGATI
ncbi:MAG: hypothetical protein M1817_005545 [Caeruleum heppii]|nr:MAG: hypothetical protein M1817_005545 [Caeruleum heppii]